MADRGVVLSLDEGTTGATAVAVGLDGAVRGKGYAEITQHYPQPGWVEHDAEEIWAAVQRTAAEAVAGAGAKPSDVRAIGITNQRETLVVWDRRTLKPLTRAIVCYEAALRVYTKADVPLDWAMTQNNLGIA